MDGERDEPESGNCSNICLHLFYLFHIVNLLYLFYLSYLWHLVYLLYLFYILFASAAFRINMWTQSKERLFLVHRLCSRIKDDQPQGYIAFDWKSILHGNAGKPRDYKELSVLPDKIARYLYEFHANLYASHSLPPLPVDRSNTNVHGILKPHQVFF